MKKAIYSILFLVSVVSLSSPAYAQLGHQSFGTLGTANTDGSFTTATKSLISDPFYFFKRLGESIRIAFGASSEERTRPQTDQTETKSEKVETPVEENKETKEQVTVDSQESSVISDTGTSVTEAATNEAETVQSEQVAQTSTENTETSKSDSENKVIPAIEVSKVIPVKILPGKFGD